MPLVNVGDVQLHVICVGRGAPVVMLHGLLIGNLTTWYFTAASALAADHRVLLYDLRGHGKSPPAADGYGVDTMAEDLSRLVDAHFASTEPVCLVGHSYGALVAMRFALRSPERVRRLVVVEAPLPPSRLEDFDALMKASPEDVLSLLPKDLQGALVRGGRQAQRFMRRMQALIAESTLVADLKAEVDIADVELAQIRCPTLCIYGTGSSLLPVAQRLRSCLPCASVLELNGGHYLHLDATAELTEAIAQFLRSEPRAAG